MKTKHLNKNLIIILTLVAMLLVSVFAFSGCKKEKFEPIELTVEQGTTAFDNAIAKAKTATNIYSDLGNGQFLYADADGYYEKWYEDPTEDLYQETWYAYENSEWVAYYYFSYGSGELESAHKSTLDEYEVGYATTFVELMVLRDIATIKEEFDFSNLTATQTAENVIEITIVEEGEGFEFSLEIKIVDEYIKNIKMTMTYDGESEIYQQSYLYNIADRDIPSIPNIEWTEW